MFLEKINGPEDIKNLNLEENGISVNKISKIIKEYIEK